MMTVAEDEGPCRLTGAEDGMRICNLRKFKVFHALFYFSAAGAAKSSISRAVRSFPSRPHWFYSDQRKTFLCGEDEYCTQSLCITSWDTCNVLSSFGSIQDSMQFTSETYIKHRTQIWIESVLWRLYYDLEAFMVILNFVGCKQSPPNAGPKHARSWQSARKHLTKPNTV